MPTARPIRTVARLALSAVAIGALVLGAAACGGDEDIEQSDFQEKLIERTAIPEPVAACITDRVYAEFEPDQIDRIVVAATIEELREAEEDLVAINAECKASYAEAAEGTEDTSGTGDGEGE